MKVNTFIIFKKLIDWYYMIMNNFYKYLYLIGLFAVIIGLVTIFSVLTEINLFFTEKIKI
ncbi:MAG: hypothetical protein CMP41_04360 [Rickettsiales bacterium]|nr:hypothetical protein [Rickettsiales bacterium]